MSDILNRINELGQLLHLESQSLNEQVNDRFKRSMEIEK